MRPFFTMAVAVALMTCGCGARLPEAGRGGPEPVYAYVAGTGVAEAVIKHDKKSAGRWLSYLKKAVDPEKLSSLMLMGALERAAQPGSPLRLASRPEESGRATLRLFTSSFGLRMPKHAGPALFVNVLFQVRGAEGRTLYEKHMSCQSRGRVVPSGLDPSLTRWAPSDGGLPEAGLAMPAALGTLSRWCGSLITTTLIHDLRL